MQQYKRNTLKIIGAAATSVVVPFLASCGGGSSSDSTESQTAPSGPPDSSATPDTPITPSTPTSPETVDWLVGGTERIEVNFPNDDVFDSNLSCQVDLFPSGVEGPCYFNVEERPDISDGTDGLPMQVCIQVIDRQCRPLTGYTVEIWHCDKRGVYSGNTEQSNDANRFDLSFCTGGDTAAGASRWGRGELITNSVGRVNFLSCFPGWYPGRTAHVHFRIRQGTQQSVVSQLRFTDDFCQEIYTTHASYSGRGNQDTLIPADFEFTSTDNKGFTLTKNSDGSLLAVKQIQVNV